MLFLTNAIITAIASASISLAAVPPSANQDYQCQTSYASPGAGNVQSAINYFRNRDGNYCAGDGGCVRMHRSDGIRVYICGPGGQACGVVADQLQTLYDNCRVPFGSEEFVGGAYWVGSRNSGTYISLSR